MSEEMRKLANEKMKFPDEEVELSKEELVEEAKSIMEEVNSDQKVVDRPLPVNLRKNIDKRILALKAKEEKTEGERFSAEERELMRLGKLYKKKRKMRKYFVLAAAVVCALAFGVTSMGGPERVFEKVNWKLAGREQTNVDSDSDKILEASSVKEEEAYQQIEEEFGFYPVKLEHLPEEVEFLEAQMSEEIQGVNLIYGKNEKVVISCFIRPNYRTGSFGTDMEDDVINEYDIQNDNVSITIKQYSVDEANNNRWSGEFAYHDVHYFIVATDMGKEEFEKILKNLYFF